MELDGILGQAQLTLARNRRLSGGLPVRGEAARFPFAWLSPGESRFSIGVPDGLATVSTFGSCSNLIAR
jgi:hypothetical protein